MIDLPQTIGAIRDAVCSILRIRKAQDQSGLQPDETRWDTHFGTAWCVVDNRDLVTACHNLGKSRDQNDKFVILTSPSNGPIAYHTPVVGFYIERPDSDMAIVEISPPPGFPAHIPAIPVTFEKPVDGERVLTYGYPSPQIRKASIGAAGDWLGGGNLLLKANANEGIVAAQYEEKSIVTYELNVGWHHGESGGPIIRANSNAAFSIMQCYRPIKTPHGTVTGPHQGISLVAIETDLLAIGASVIS